MDRTRDHNNCFAFIGQGGAEVYLAITRVEPGIGEAPLNPFILFKIADILRRADEGDEHCATESGFADGLQLNAVACAVQPREVIADLFPVRDGAIVAGIETENRTRRRYCTRQAPALSQRVVRKDRYE